MLPLFHTFLGFGAFMIAAVVSVFLHYFKIIELQGPGEWLPSCMLIVGGFFPERAIFQILAAVASSSHLTIIFLWYLITRSKKSKLPEFICFSGLVRTAFLAGIIYVPSPDDHELHDICVAGYLFMTFIWFQGLLKFSSGSSQLTLESGLGLSLPKHKQDVGENSDDSTIVSTDKEDEKMESYLHQQERLRLQNGDSNSKKPTSGYAIRKQLAAAYYILFIPLCHYMLQYRVYRVPGSYSRYAFFEWVAVLLDIGFDAVSALEFDGLEFRVVALPQGYEDESPDEKDLDKSIQEERTNNRKHGHYV